MEEIISNVMQSPENTNPNVLRGQLSKIGGGSGGGVADIEATSGENNTLVVNMTADELVNAMQQGARIYISFPQDDVLMTSWVYLSAVLDNGAVKIIRLAYFFGNNIIGYEGTEQNGKTVFSAL